MRTVSIVVAVLASLSQPGCSGGASSGSGAGASGQNGPNAATDPNASSNGTVSDPSASPTCTAGCPETPDGGATPTPSGPARILSLLSAHQAGRAGEDVVLSFEGTSEDASAFALEVALADQAGNAVIGFRNWAGVPATSKRVVLFDHESAEGVTDFQRVVTLPGFLRDFPTLRTVDGAFVDATGRSNAMSTSITMQTVKNLGQTCDPDIVLDRCASGLACPRTSSKCEKPSPPALTKFAYLTSELGAEMLFAGSAPADDLDALHLEFLDDAGNPVQVDMTGNKDFKTSFDIPIFGASQRGSFFYSIESAPSFSASVTQLAATPMGASGNGERVTAVLREPTLAATGEACDLRGFAMCAASDACVAGQCASLATVRAAAALKARKLDPSANNKLATGYATGATIWGDPPEDCIPAGLHDLPEGAVHLHLAHGTPSLTLTSDNDETNGKLALFVLPGTGANVGKTPLGCASGSPATLTLTNVSGGDYTIVVASLRATGANFGVSIK